jgi:hypothetical protein
VCAIARTGIVPRVAKKGWFPKVLVGKVNDEVCERVRCIHVCAHLLLAPPPAAQQERRQLAESMTALKKRKKQKGVAATTDDVPKKASDVQSAGVCGCICVQLFLCDAAISRDRLQRARSESAHWTQAEQRRCDGGRQRRQGGGCVIMCDGGD